MRLLPLVLVVTELAFTLTVFRETGVSLAYAEPRCSHATAADPERQEVAETVQLYLQGHATGNGDYFRKAFHPEAKLFWVKDGVLGQRTSAEFIGGATGRPADDEARRVRKIAMIDIADDAAIAKVELDYPDVTIVDYLSLLKLDGTWVVINKIFHRGAPKPTVSSHR
jgi:hypothetical protein